MAKLNQVYMMGVIQDDPVIKVTNTGEYVVSQLKILTARRSYQNEKQNLAGVVRSDIQQIITRSSYVIDKFILDLEVGDLVLVKGTLSTRDIIKKIRCPYCGDLDESSIGVKVYIDPICILKVRSVKDCSEQEITDLLVTYAELSNYATFFATLVKEPRYGPDYGSPRRELGCHAALNRKRYITEDGPDKKTDYPYIRMFGQMAENCNKVLHTGSEIYLESAIETREVELEKRCPSCGETFYLKNVAVEIVPYSVEFTENVDVTPLRDDYEEPEDEDDGYEEDYESDEEGEETDDYDYPSKGSYDESRDYDGYDDEEDE